MGASHSMRIQSVRFSEKAWAAIQEEARKEGVSASQYVREAALMRVTAQDAYRAFREGDVAERLARLEERCPGLLEIENGRSAGSD
jgi:hypothetical protein